MEVTEGIARGAEVVRKALRQTLIKGGVFHINHHAADILLGDLLGQAVGFVLGRHFSGHGDIPCPIRKHDHQGEHIRVSDLFAFEDL